MALRMPAHPQNIGLTRLDGQSGCNSAAISAPALLTLGLIRPSVAHTGGTYSLGPIPQSAWTHAANSAQCTKPGEDRVYSCGDGYLGQLGERVETLTCPDEQARLLFILAHAQTGQTLLHVLKRNFG